MIALLRACLAALVFVSAPHCAQACRPLDPTCQARRKLLISGSNELSPVYKRDGLILAPNSTADGQGCIAFWDRKPTGELVKLLAGVPTIGDCCRQCRATPPCNVYSYCPVEGGCSLDLGSSGGNTQLPFRGCELLEQGLSEPATGHPVVALEALGFAGGAPINVTASPIKGYDLLIGQGYFNRLDYPCPGSLVNYSCLLQGSPQELQARCDEDPRCRVMVSLPEGWSYLGGVMTSLKGGLGLIVNPNDTTLNQNTAAYIKQAPPPPAPPAPVAGTSDSGGLSGGSIAGIVVGGCAGAAVVAAGALLLVKRHRRRRDGQQHETADIGQATARSAEGSVLQGKADNKGSGGEGAQHSGGSGHSVLPWQAPSTIPHRLAHGPGTAQQGSQETNASSRGADSQLFAAPTANSSGSSSMTSRGPRAGGSIQRSSSRAASSPRRGSADQEGAGGPVSQLTSESRRQRSLVKSEAASSTSSPTAAALLSSVGDAPWSDWVVNIDAIEFCRAPNGSYQELGTGGFGIVYKVLLDGVQMYAAKVVELGQGEELQNAFLKEAHLMRRLRHRNIVNFRGVCITEGKGILLMELMEGGDLQSKVSTVNKATNERLFSWRGRGKRVALDVARGIHYLHSLSLTHFDIKANNVLLTRDLTAKISDVGFTRLMSNTHHSIYDGRMGTFDYMAPELLMGRPCTESVDIFSFGILLWEICTGEHPKRGRNRPLTTQDCPQGVIDLYEACTSEESAARPSAKELVQRLTQLAAPPGSIDRQ